MSTPPAVVARPPSDREVLEQRARQLARPPSAAPAVTEPFLLFAAGGTTLGVGVGTVRGVRRTGGLTRLPTGNEPIVAVLEDRGDVIAIVPAADLVGAAPSPQADAVVVLDDGQRPPLGLLVDGPPRLVDVPVDRIGRPPEGLERPAGHLVRGVTATGDVLLDAGALLDDPAFTSRNETR